MIQSFDDAASEDIFHGAHTKAARRIATALWPVVRRKLDMIHAAVAVRDLRIPPNNRLEALKGDHTGRFSIRVNQQFRITFRFEDGNAFEVRCEDYH
jgi:toxin HigB-1